MSDHPASAASSYVRRCLAALEQCSALKREGYLTAAAVHISGLQAAIEGRDDPARGPVADLEPAALASEPAEPRAACEESEWV